MSEETPAEDIGRLQITIKPLTAQREETYTEQQVTNLVEESIISTQDRGGEIDTKKPEYAITKEKIRKLSKEIAASRKRKRIQEQEQGKGKRNLIIAESLENEDELAAMAVDIIEDIVANKIPMEAQFQKFVEAGTQQGRSKKVKSTNTSTAENVVDLVSTPPSLSPTQITQEEIPKLPSISQVDICKNAMLETLKERFDQDRDF